MIHTITDFNKYNSQMAQGKNDKTDFLETILEDKEVTTFLDYGCADGTIILELAEKYPNITFYGYDNDITMINTALENALRKHCSNVWFNCYLPDIDPAHTIFFCSSLVHEVYSYLPDSEVIDFWDFVNNTGFRYIAMRELALPANAFRDTTEEDLHKLLVYENNRHNNFYYLTSFEKYQGNTNIQYNLIHYLMKYNYTENWDREVRENYLPLTNESMRDKINKEKYDVVMYYPYTLSYLKNKVMEDFGIEITDTTHVKMIFRRKK